MYNADQMHVAMYNKYDQTYTGRHQRKLDEQIKNGGDTSSSPASQAMAGSSERKIKLFTQEAIDGHYEA